MTKTLMLAGALMLAIGGNAFAASAAPVMKCDDASMKKMQTDMDANSMATKDQKDMAMKEMQMAMDSMKANKLDDCSMHMGMANDAMMKK